VVPIDSATNAAAAQKPRLPTVDRACSNRGVISMLLLVAAQAPPSPAVAPRAALVVHIVDADGALVLEDFTVHATQLAPGSSLAMGPGRQAKLDPQDGTATFEVSGPGRYHVRASHATGTQAIPVVVEVRARERLSCELQLPMPPSRCLFIETSLEWPQRIEGLQLFARGESGEAIPLVLAPGETNRYIACGVPPGQYTVSLTDPRYCPVSLVGVPTGEVRRLELKGSASVTLRCKAEPEGATVHPRALEVQYNPFDWPSMRMHVGSELVELESVPTGDLVAVAHFTDRPPVRFELTGLLHGERRELLVEVPPGAALTGRVIDPAGEPVAGVPVVTYTGLGVSGVIWSSFWLEPGRDREPDRSISSREDTRRRRVARTDTAGRYTFAGLAHGAHTVIAYGTPFTHREIEARIASTHGEHSAPDLVLEGSGSADFDVRLPADLDVLSLSFELQVGRGGSLNPLDPSAAPVLDDRGRLVLRGLPELGCTLVISRWVEHVAPAGTKWREQIALARVPFRPRRGAMTPVVLDLRAP
jgi:hypothetical protein